MLPPPVIERQDQFYIAREDLLPGGTKRRALLRWLPEIKTDHFIYAGSVYGAGGWALAEACRDLGFRCTLALSKSEYRPHWLDRIDCTIEWHDPQPVQDILAIYKDHPGLLPLGFDDDAFRTHLSDIFRTVDVSAFSEVWMSCVSGTMLRAAQDAWPTTPLNAVCVAKHHGDIGKARKYDAAEKYHQAARYPPPYSAHAFSDAKTWIHAKESGLSGGLIWNTCS